ncbi:uncharacterized protein PFB0765w-like [Pseudomyrmex gracilis]|uniref:uncharacterized protein PFB0765w-like n=1 Tax=Pseudomyrmex gracilis TaxID=219809 RepID=UPI000995AF0A|nr:uncharacterized protein PFB0765w-like [Pseudomyrmex gracilis]
MYSSFGWPVTDNNVTKRMIDNSLTHTFLPSQKIRRRTKILNNLQKNRKLKTYNQYIMLKTSVLRNVKDDTETDYDTGLTDGECSLIYNSPAKQTQYVTENFEKYIFFSDDECVKSKKKKTKTAANIKAKMQEEQVTKKKKEMVPEVQNEKSVSCHTEASETHGLGWQDVTKHNGNISQLPDNLARTADVFLNNKEDNVNYINKYVNNRDTNVTIDKAISQNVTHSNRTSIDSNVIENYEIDFINNIEDFEIDENMEDKLNCDQLLSYNTKSQHDASSIETAFDNMSLDQQEDLQDELDKIEESSKSDIKNLSHLDIMQEMLDCPKELKEIAEAIILNDFREVTENTCYSDIKNPDTSKEANEFFKEEQNFPCIDQVDKDVSINQEETIYSIQEVNSCDIKEQILPPPERSLVKDKHSKVCKNLNNIFEEQDKRETISLSNQESNNFPRLNQVDNNVDVNSISQDEVQLIKAEESPHQNSLAKVLHSTGEEDKQNSSKEQNNVSVSTNQKDMIHFMQTPDLFDVQIQEISSSKQSPRNNVHSKICNNISQDKNNRQIQVVSNQENSCDLNASDKNTESDTISQENTIHCTKTEEFSDARPTTEQSPKTDVLSPKQNQEQDIYSCIDISEEQNNEEVKEFVEQVDEELTNYSINNEDKTPVTKSEVTCNTAKEQLSLRVTGCEIINTKYRIDKRIDDVSDNVDKIDNSLIDECSPIKNNMLINSTNVSDYNIDKNAISEIDYEKNDECYISRARKRREQLERLNLVVCSDSSESDDTTEHNINFNKSFINNRSLINKENVCDESNHCNNRQSIGAETRRFNSHEENVEISTNRPCNLQELVENEKLVAETMPPTLTLADISDEEEAYILNIPPKLLECNLKNQLLTLKENTIKFGKTKYRIADKRVNTISWVFATGKKRKPYRIVNLNNISTITVLDNASHCSKTASRDVVASSETDRNKRQEKKSNLKMSKILKHNNRKRNNSDVIVGPALKKRCN